MKLFKSPPPKTPGLSRDDALACIPDIAPSIEWQADDSGTILVEYQLAIKPLLLAIFRRFNKNQPKRMTRKLQLDSLGSRVWTYIDGKRTVSAIISEFALETTITRQEAEQSVTTFLRELGKRGLIILR
ncbi:PqqD family protein [Desulfosediminicola flagellatus]|uniref:PqqD family protein n=1 Tax=Desulfosediminicola flagellatus TaxID=2569541 RepID=UPI0010AD8D8E|nr:PqqD family protein [Desulfosediminicola flagellatus]